MCIYVYALSIKILSSFFVFNSVFLYEAQCTMHDILFTNVNLYEVQQN